MFFVKNSSFVKGLYIMRVTDYIKSSVGTAFSFEVLPPLKGTGTDGLFKNIDKLTIPRDKKKEKNNI